MEEAPNDVESCKMHSEDDKAGLEKNRKRTVKTQAQVQELEKFYNEHKYPTESMKMQVAEAIGLTEKQVSGWFCHRRLKDKRLLSGDNNVISKQDRSSGVIQDRGSGQRQDSCGSTKQGDGRNFDGREVESGILTIQDSSAVELRYENGGHFFGNKNHMDDTSSGSSSSLRDMSNHHQGDPFDVATSRYLVPKLPMDVKARRGPSGYLKVKGQVENSAITAVKRQLGKHYREDGPPLGVEFDPLPPGAFEDSMENPVDETYYTEEATLPVSPDFSNIHQRFKFGKGNEYSSSRALLNSDIDRTSFRTPQVYAGDRSGSESRDDYKMKYTQDFQVKRTNSVPAISHAQLPGANLRRERKPSFRKYNDVCRNSSKGEYELSDLPIKGSEYPDSFNPAQISKDGKAYVERITNENWAMIPYKTDRFATKKMRGEFWKKASLLDNETGTYRSIRGVAAEMPSSFTEDDGSAQTSCSVE